MNDQDSTLSFSYHARPWQCFLAAIIIVVLGGFILSEAHFGQVRPTAASRTISQVIGGVLLFCAAGSAIQGFRILKHRPHIVFGHTKIVVPNPITMRKTVIEYRDIKSAVIGYKQETRHINIERGNGKPLWLSETVFFSKKEFEDCWGVLDSLSGAQVLDAAVAGNYSIRVLCPVCGAPTDSGNEENRCSDCVGVTAGDIRRIGVIAIALGLVLFSIGCLSFVFATHIGFGIVLTGFIIIGFMSLAAGFMLLVTGRVNNTSMSLLSSTGLLSLAKRQPTPQEK